MLEFPTSTFPAAQIRWRLEGAAVNGGRTLSNQSSLIATTGGGYWTCDLAISLNGAAAIKAARVLIERLDNGAEPLNLRTCEAKYSPSPFGSVTAAVATPAALRATTLSIDMGPGCSALIGGERFSIDHGTGYGVRLYTIVTAGAADGSGVQACTIRPPLRKAVASDAINFNTPGCQVICTNTSEALAAVNMGVVGTLNLNIEEDFGD